MQQALDIVKTNKTMLDSRFRSFDQKNMVLPHLMIESIEKIMDMFKANDLSMFVPEWKLKICLYFQSELMMCKKYLEQLSNGNNFYAQAGIQKKSKDGKLIFKETFAEMLIKTIDKHIKTIDEAYHKSNLN